MVRGRDACWEHCVLIDATRQKIKNKDIVPCTEVPNDVRDHIQTILSTPKKQKASKKLKVDRAANCQQHSSSASGGIHPDQRSSGQNGSSSPSLLFPRPSPSSQPITDNIQKQKHAEADKRIAAFFFQNSIPFTAAKSVYYHEMVGAIAECGLGYRAPSHDKLRSSLLEKVKADINETYKKLRDGWKETGCTVLCDCWSDGRSKTLAAISVTCPKGTIFMRSIDISGHGDDPHYLLELLESVILEVGTHNIVQVITNSSISYIYAGRLLMEKYPSIFWSPCASDCVNKILEDFSKLDWVNRVLEEASAIIKYIYSNDWILSLMRKFTCGGELIRPKISRFVARFVSLRSLVIQEDNLKHMFSHTEWLSSIYSGAAEAHTIISLLYLERFWKSAREAVSVSEPLVKILRIVDGDMPAMGYIYEGMERAKISIKAYYKSIEEKYVPIWDIIDRRWYMQLHSPLHAAAAFLNPSIFYSQCFKVDSRMRNGFQEAMIKMSAEEKDKVEITKEHPVYLNAQGALGTEFAVKGRTLNTPGDWWAGYGYEIPTLQRAALRILSQPCSSHWCRWNWNTFEGLHEMGNISRSILMR